MTIDKSQSTVLLVDDEASVRFVVRELLESHGYRVLEAESGAQAIEIYETHWREIDLLFTDLQMPGMSGNELAGRLRKKNPGLRVLYTSGSGISVVEAMLNSDQKGNFIPKPSRESRLVIAVRDAISVE